VYLVYLIVIVSTGKAAIPIVSLVMIGAVYGLQVIIFLLKREFMLIGWMIIYILAFVSLTIHDRTLLTPL
jgi:chitin synthase